MRSLRKMALVVTMTGLILVTLFPSYVRADVQLTSAFVEPVKNWSFEDRDMSQPGDGVYRVPPWETNNGGWRELPGDVSPDDGDGVVDLLDALTVRGAFGSTPGDPNWNPYADINGDGVVDVFDALTVSADFGKEANRIDGSYSWYTSGGGDYQMWQWLDSDAVQAVAGQTVMFGFWFYPKYALSGNQSDPTERSVSYGEPAWISVSNLTYTPPSDQRIRLRKVQLDTRVTNGSGYYKITYIKEGGAETVIVTDQLITNTEYETKKHAANVLGDEGKSITVKFYLFQSFDEPRPTFAKNFYMFYDGGVDARAEIYYEYNGGSNTIYGVWIAPTEFNWWNAYVTASLPSTTTAVKVIIHGMPDFKAYIDHATFSIVDHQTVSSSYGKLTVGVNIYDWIKRQQDPDGLVGLRTALYAESSASNYGIRAIILKAELLPNDGSSTDQDGFINVYYTGQSNDRGYEIDPAVTEEVQAKNLEIQTFLIRVGTGMTFGLATATITAATGGLGTIPTILMIFLSSSGSTIVGSQLVAAPEQFASDPNDRHANGGVDPTDYFVLEQWDYPTYIKEYEQKWFVGLATGHYTMDWTFRTWTAENFQIKVTAFVNWGEIIYHHGRLFDYWTLDDRGWDAISTTITITA